MFRVLSTVLDNHYRALPGFMCRNTLNGLGLNTVLESFFAPCGTRVQVNTDDEAINRALTTANEMYTPALANGRVYINPTNTQCAELKLFRMFHPIPGFSMPIKFEDDGIILEVDSLMPFTVLYNMLDTMVANRRFLDVADIRYSRNICPELTLPSIPKLQMVQLASNTNTCIRDMLEEHARCFSDRNPKVKGSNEDVYANRISMGFEPLYEQHMFMGNLAGLMQMYGVSTAWLYNFYIHQAHAEN